MPKLENLCINEICGDVEGGGIEKVTLNGDEIPVESDKSVTMETGRITDSSGGVNTPFALLNGIDNNHTDSSATIEIQLDKPEVADEVTININDTDYAYLPSRDYVDTQLEGKVSKIKVEHAEVAMDANQTVDIPAQVGSVTHSQFGLRALNVNGVNSYTLGVQKVNDKIHLNSYDTQARENIWEMDIPSMDTLATKMDLVDTPTENNVLITDANGQAIDSGLSLEEVAEPFRVKQWAASFDVTIPSVTQDIANSQIPKITYKIEGQEAIDYQIVGMIAYEVFDAASGGNRINYIPVCQFTGGGQTELSVRGCVMGPNSKQAKRISAWVLLKHR